MKLNKIINGIGYVAKIFQSIPSRIFFGTTTRFWAANVYPYCRLLMIPQRYSLTSKSLRADGYLKVNTALDFNFWNSLVTKYTQAMESPDKSYLTKNEKTRRLIDPKNILGPDSINLILQDDKILDAVNGYWGREFRLKEVNAWRNFPATTGEYVYSNFWHMDDVSYTSLRVFCYLSSNINKNSGATRIANIHTSKKLVRMFKFLHTSIDGFRREEEGFPYTYLDGNIGDVFIFSADRCLHAATSIKNNQPRDMLELVIDLC